MGTENKVTYRHPWSCNHAEGWCCATDPKMKCTEAATPLGLPLVNKLTVIPQEGTKLDAGKQRYDLLAPEGLAGLVDVLTYGATKYDARNWEKGISYSRVFGAAMRHLWAWWSLRETDDETGLSHLDHAACCIHFLSTYTKRQMTKYDDRPEVK